MRWKANVRQVEGCWRAKKGKSYQDFTDWRAAFRYALFLVDPCPPRLTEQAVTKFGKGAA